MKMQIKLKKLNKKADLSVVAFVLLVLLLCGYALYSIAAHKSGINLKLEGHDSPEQFLLEKKDLEYRLYKNLEECTIQAYQEFVERGSYLSGPIQEIEGKIVLGDLNINLEEEFSQVVRICVQEKAEAEYALNLPDWKNKPFLSAMNAWMKRGDFSLEVSEEKINLLLKDFPLSKDNDGAEYRSNLSSEILFEKIGLIWFSNFYEIVECREDKQCFTRETKDLFEVSAISLKKDELDYLIFNLESRREFLIEGDFERISFEFLVEN